MKLASPLHICSVLGNVECARILLRNGASLDAKDEAKNTPITLLRLAIARVEENRCGGGLGARGRAREGPGGGRSRCR